MTRCPVQMPAGVTTLNGAGAMRVHRLVVRERMAPSSWPSGFETFGPEAPPPKTSTRCAPSATTARPGVFATGAGGASDTPTGHGVGGVVDGVSMVDRLETSCPVEAARRPHRPPVPRRGRRRQRRTLRPAIEASAFAVITPIRRHRRHHRVTRLEVNTSGSPDPPSLRLLYRGRQLPEHVRPTGAVVLDRISGKAVVHEAPRVLSLSGCSVISTVVEPVLAHRTGSHCRQCSPNGRLSSVEGDARSSDAGAPSRRFTRLGQAECHER